MYNTTFNTVPSGLQIEIRDTVRGDGYTTLVRSDLNSIYGEAVYAQINRVVYLFDRWDDQSTANPRTFYPTDHSTYTLYYLPKPLPPANVSAGGTVGDYVHLSWQSHPSELVTEFKIWRKVKPKNQNERSPVLIATVSSSTTSYIDYDYTVTNGYTDDLVSYDVRSSMSYDGSTIYSDPSYVAVFAEIAPKIAVNMPVDFNIEAFPNPFNPSTRILYSLKHAGDLRLTIVDVTGREVATLKSGYQAEGRQSIVWNGTNMAGSTVGSGVYFARMVVTGEDGSAVYENTIRLLLTK